MTGCESSPTHAKQRFNPTETYGGRAALKVNLGDNWTVSPTFMGQSTRADGTSFVDPAIPGSLSVERFYPDSISDQWWQAALTVEGHVSNFDITYAGGYLNRNDHTQSDYSDYSLLYDQHTTYTSYMLNNIGNVGGKPINPSQHINGTDQYRKMSHELRVATPRENRLRFVGGLFYERQEHYILQDYLIDELPATNAVTGWPTTLWLTDQIRVDRDTAVFGELTFDFTKNPGRHRGLPVLPLRQFDRRLLRLREQPSSHTGERARRINRTGHPRRRSAPRQAVVVELVVDQEGGEEERLDAQVQPDVQNHRRCDGVRDLREGFPSGWHQPAHPVATVAIAGDL